MEQFVHGMKMTFIPSTNKQMTMILTSK